MQYDLVFEGGGAKGMVFVGAMQAFMEAGFSSGRLIGTSAGAITATTLAAGYSPEEMLETLTEMEGDVPVFSTFLGAPPPFPKEQIVNSATRNFLRAFDLPLMPDFAEEKFDDRLVETIAADPRLRHLFSFVERGGWYSAHNFIAWLQRKLDEGTYKGRPRRFSAMTMAEMFAVTKTDLTLTGSDITDGRLLILNHRTTPDLPVVWAVRMSMSVPLLWQEVVWEKSWGTYRGQSLTGHAIVDGGLLSNFPIELLVSSAPMVTAVMGKKINENVMGFLIDETLPVAGAPAEVDDGVASAIGDLQTVKRVGQLVNTMIQARDKMVIDTFENLVVRLPAKGFGTTEFNMTPQRRDALVQAGKKTTEAYLEAKFSGLESAEMPIDPERAEEEANRIALGILGR